MSTSPENKLFGDFPSPEFLSPEVLSSARVADDVEDIAATKLADRFSETFLKTLPNDLTRMIYLASLRDCNSGLYLQPELSQQEGFPAADRALRLCHERCFAAW